jgi:hypothetical protein
LQLFRVRFTEYDAETIVSAADICPAATGPSVSESDEAVDGDSDRGSDADSDSDGDSDGMFASTDVGGGGGAGEVENVSLPRPSSDGGSGGGGAASPAGAAVLKKWKCRRCMNSNKAETLVCIECRAMRRHNEVQVGGNQLLICKLFARVGVSVGVRVGAGVNVGVPAVACALAHALAHALARTLARGDACLGVYVCMYARAFAAALVISPSSISEHLCRINGGPTNYPAPPVRSNQLKLNVVSQFAGNASWSCLNCRPSTVRATTPAQLKISNRLCLGATMTSAVIGKPVTSVFARTVSRVTFAFS